MPKLIKDGELVENTWQLLREGLDDKTWAELEGSNVILPLQDWLSSQAEISERDGETGVWLASDQTPAELGDTLDKLPLIALDFPVFSDGRAYTSARELRQNLNYTGELRAIGDVLRDQLFYMARCGFNAFDLREDQDPKKALTAFDDFSDGYQASVDQPLPLFRRRSA